MTVLRILFATAFVYSICNAAGRLLLRAIGLKLRKSESLFLAFIAGSAAVSTVVFGLAAAHLIYTWILGGVGAVILGAWLAFGRSRGPREREADEAALPLFWRILFWAPYLIYGVLYVLAAMMPEISPDGTVYHVGLVVRYYEHRGFYPLTTEMYSGLSGGIEMLFLVAFAFGRHSATAMVHLLFLLSIPLGMLSLARRMNVPQAGIIGALLFYISPVVGRDGTCAYIDVATAAVVFAAFYFLEIWRTGEGNRALIPAGLLAGFAYACKFTAGIAALYGVLYVIWVCRSGRAGWSRSFRTAAAFSALVCVTALPWVVKDLVQFHNPFYPLFNDWFPNPFQYPMIEAEWRGMLAHMNGITLAQIPWQVTVGGRLDGILGPVFLLSPIALLSLRSPTGRRLLLVFLPLFLPYFGNIGARFTIPALPFLSMALGLGLLGIPGIGSGLAVAVVLVHAVTSWPQSIDRWFPEPQWRIDPPKLKVVLRKMPEQEFLRDHWPEFEPGLMLDGIVPQGEKVFSPGMGQMAYQHRELLGSFDSAAGRRAWDTLFTPLLSERAATWTREFAFAPQTVRGVRLAVDSVLTEGDLSVIEMRFFEARRELTRKASWRLKATSNVWEVQRAFDADLVSWWTSGARAEPGTSLEADFGSPTRMDTVVVEQIVDQRWTKLRVEANIDGEWRTLRARETGTEHLPRPDLRMEVRDELKAQGIRWVLMPDSTPYANDLKTNAPYWGITQMGAVNGYTLWRLD